MANDFSQDSTCKALWRFETAGLTTDSKSTNTLTLSGTPPTADGTNVREGSTSGAFARASAEYAYITDANLSSGFPLKSDDTTKQATFCFWARFTSIPTSGQYHQILCKSLAGSDTGLEIQLCYATGAKFRIVWGLTATTQTTWDVVAAVASRWYHFAVIIDGVNKTWKCRIYDASTTVTTNYTGTAPASELRVNSRTLYIGAYDTIANYLDGNLDELVVFNRLLIDQEVDSIRNQYFATNVSISADLFSSVSSIPQINYAGGEAPGVLFMSGFELDDPYAGWDTYTLAAGDTRSQTRYRGGQYSMLLTNANSNFRKNIHAHSSLYLQVAICWSGATPAAGKYLRWYKGATVLGTLNVDSSARIAVYTGDGSTLCATGTTILEMNTWYVIELYLNISDSGTFTVKIDGVEEFDWDGDTQPGTDTDVNIVELMSPTASDVFFDDFFIISPNGSVNNSWTDRARIECLMPFSDASKSWSSSYTLPSTNHFPAFRGMASSDRSNYFYTKTAGLSEMFNLNNCPLGATQDIVAVQAYGQFLTPTSTAGASVLLFLQSGSTVYTSSQLFVTPEVPYGYATPTVKTFHFSCEANPVTQSRWTANEIDSLIMGFRKVG